jgi:ATP-dependent Clp protease adapter protein ClpS
MSAPGTTTATGIHVSEPRHKKAVLERFFNKDHETAHRIMMHVHQHGIGECGVYTYEVAETKVTANACPAYVRQPAKE